MPNDIAFIAGGFTIVGVLLGALITYQFALKLAQKNADNAARQAEANALRDARSKFFAAFAPAIAQIYLARHHGTHDTPVVGDILKELLIIHATAIEEFRPFVKNEKAYQEAWEEYRKTVREDNFVIDSADSSSDTPEAPRWSFVENQINAILDSAK